MKSQHYEEAAKSFNYAVGIDPAIAPGWYNLARISATQGKKGEALSKLRKAISLDPALKEAAKEDGYFKRFWRDKDFKTLAK